MSEPPIAFSLPLSSLPPEDAAQIRAGFQWVLNRVVSLENSIAVMATIAGITTAALDRPMAKLPAPGTMTELLLGAIETAGENGHGSDLLEVLRSALQLGSKMPEPDGDGTPRSIADNVIDFLSPRAA